MRREVLVVGGGPAGASAALGFLSRGFGATVLEQRPQWHGRVCGAFLDPEAVGHLRTLGVLDQALARGAVRVEKAIVTTPDSADTVYLRQGGETALGLPRRNLEELLLEAVRRAGGRVRLGSRARAFERTRAGWRVETAGPAAAFEADLLALADGRFSLARRGPALKPAHGWYGWNAPFENVRQDPGRMSLHFHPGGYVGVITFADGTSNVCGLTHRVRGESREWESVFRQALRRQPYLAETLAGARCVGEWQGVGPLPFTASRRPMKGPLLVGDAAAVCDPFMGEGLGRALGAGPLIRAALGARPDDVSEDALRRRYAALWDRQYRGRLRLGLLTRQALRRPALFRAIFAPLARRPRWIERLTPLFHRAFPTDAHAA